MRGKIGKNSEWYTGTTKNRRPEVTYLNPLIRFFDTAHMLPASTPRVGEMPSSRSMYGEYLRIAVPSVMEMVLISLINMMDTVMVSGLGTDAVAAVGLVGQPRMLLLCFFLALNVGITAVVARRKGENKADEANATVRTAVVTILGLSAVLMASLLPLAEPLMRFAGAEEGRTLAESTEYFVILGWALPFQALSMGLCAAQRGIGNTKLTMKVNITSNVVNVIFNFLLINGIGPFPRLGVRGAAIATALGMFVGFVLSLYAMVKDQTSFLHFSFRQKWTMSLDALRALVKVASSAMVEQLAMRIGFFSYAKIVAGLGTDAFAAHQIVCQFMNLSFSFADGLGIAGTSLVGQNLGKKRPDLAHVFGILAQRFALCIGLVLASICIFLRGPLVSMFLSGDNSGVVRIMAETIMISLGIVQPLQMVSVVTSGALRGAGDVLYTARVSLLTIACIRPILAVLGVYVGSQIIGDTTTALALAWCATLCDMSCRVILFKRRYDNGKWQKIRV